MAAPGAVGKALFLAVRGDLRVPGIPQLPSRNSKTFFGSSAPVTSQSSLPHFPSCHGHMFPVRSAHVQNRRGR